MTKAAPLRETAFEIHYFKNYITQGGKNQVTNEQMALKIQQGETPLLGDLLEQNRQFAYWKSNRLYAQYYDRCKASGVELDDIVQSCFLALCDAVAAFNPDDGYKLLTYTKYPLMNAVNALLCIRTKKRNALNESFSLDKPLDDENGDTHLDLLADPNSGEAFTETEDAIFNDELRAELETALDRLDDRQAAVVRKRYLDDVAQGVIAAELGVSQQLIHQLEIKALRKLRGFKSLQQFHDEVLENLSYKRTGLRAFRETGYSSVERAVEIADELTENRRVANAIVTKQ
jgi:RNA polymerase sigma factor (sigma-70 family)